MKSRVFIELQLLLRMRKTVRAICARLKHAPRVNYGGYKPCHLAKLQYTYHADISLIFKSRYDLYMHVYAQRVQFLCILIDMRGYGVANSFLCASGKDRQRHINVASLRCRP